MHRAATPADRPTARYPTPPGDPHPMTTTTRHSTIRPPAYPSRAQLALTRRHNARRSARRMTPLPEGLGVLRTVATAIAALAFLLAMMLSGAKAAHGADCSRTVVSQVTTSTGATRIVVHSVCAAPTKK